MKQTFRYSVFLIIAFSMTLSILSCGDEDFKPDSDWVVYDEGQELRFTDKDSAEYKGVVHYIEKGHAVISIDGVLPIHCTSINNRVNMWVDLGSGPPLVSFNGFRENITKTDKNYPGILPTLVDMEFNGREYTNVVRTVINADTVKYNVYSQRNRGIVAITDRDNPAGFSINR